MIKFILNDKQRWLILAGISIASFIGCIDFTIVNTALPAIQATFKTTISELQWIIKLISLEL